VRQPLVAALGSAHGSKLRPGLEVIDIFYAVLDEEGFLEVLQLQLAHAAVELREHRGKDGIFFGISAGLGGGRMHCKKEASSCCSCREGSRDGRTQPPPWPEKQEPGEGGAPIGLL
jgi:hypothetical protein